MWYLITIIGNFPDTVLVLVRLLQKYIDIIK